MKNTGITYTSAERSPVILPEMAELLPPLSAEQLDALEADLIKNGCYVIVNCCNDPQKLKAIRHRIQAQMNGLDMSAGKVQKRVRFLERFAFWTRKETSDGAA